MTFGGMLKSILPGPNYTTPDPQTSPLDQASDLLQQRVARANKIATSPLAQLLAPEQVAAARAFVPQATEQLQKIQQQKAGIQAGRTQAQTLGLAPGEVSDQATQADRLEAAKAKALSGDMRAFQGISAVDPTTAAAIAPQVHEVVAGHLANAQLAFDSLAGMTNQGQYNAKLNQLRQDGTLTDLESLGMKIPPTFDAFNATKGSEGLALRNAGIAMQNLRQTLEDRNTYQPMAKDEAATHDGRLKTAYGDSISGGPWSRNASSGARGQVVNGLGVPDDLGRTATPLPRRNSARRLKRNWTAQCPLRTWKSTVRGIRIYQIGTVAPRDGLYDNGLNNGGTVRLKQGDALPQGTYNTNPNIQTGISEGLASMLRGGRGGANPSLLNIESSKRGAIQTIFDKAKAAYGSTINTLTGEQLKPYLTNLTQQQVRDVMDGLKQWNDSSIADRVGDIAKRAGALGLDTCRARFGAKMNPVALSAIRWNKGAKRRSHACVLNFQAIGGGDGVLQLNAQRPGAGAVALPPGQQNVTQTPGAQPLLTPVQQSQQPPTRGTPATGQPPTSQQPPTGGTPPVPPVTVAGQQVSFNLPQGASPAYVNSLQRIETGNERSPWTAGTKTTSASGAFQAIKKYMGREQAVRRASARSRRHAATAS